MGGEVDGTGLLTCEMLCGIIQCSWTGVSLEANNVCRNGAAASTSPQSD